MDSTSSNNNNNETITHNFPPFFKVYKDGRVERYMKMEPATAGSDPDTGIQSKDVVFPSSQTGLKARIFLPKINGPDQKLPLVVHYHGGGFCIGSALDLPFKRFLSNLVSQANVIAITIDYRLAPENPLPIAHNDAWDGLQWIASHVHGKGPDPWINQYADLNRVYLAGESAGANIAHYVAVKAGATNLSGLNIVGMVLVHPYFGLKEVDKLYEYMCPTSTGFDNDPIINPGVDPNLKSMKCNKVLVCVAEKDMLKKRGVGYYEIMSKSSEWKGNLELYETVGEDHCFHMFNPKSENVGPLMKKLVDFIKG